VREVNEAAKPETAAGAGDSTVPRSSCPQSPPRSPTVLLRDQQSELDHRERSQAGVTHVLRSCGRRSRFGLPGARHGSVDRAGLERTESLKEPRRSDPVSAAATRSPSQPGEASFRLGSPYGVAQICPSVECKRFEGGCLVRLPRASLWLGAGRLWRLCPCPFAQGARGSARLDRCARRAEALSGSPDGRNDEHDCGNCDEDCLGGDGERDRL
jgi:hypothetical protein